MKTVNCILLLLFVTGVRSVSSAEEPNSVTPKDLEFVCSQAGSLHDLLVKQESLVISFDETGLLEPGFGMDDTPEVKGTYKLYYKRDKFLYDVEITTSKGMSYSEVESYDGVKYQMLNRIGERLTMSSKPFVNDIVMSESHLVFMPFLFLQTAFASKPFAQLSYAEMADPKGWKKSTTQIMSSRADMIDKHLVRIEKLGASLDPVSRQIRQFTVYFDLQANGYPTKWELISPQGEITAAYTVEKIGFVKGESRENIPYPQISVLRHYKEGKLKDRARFEVTECRIGGVADEDTSIDPTSATEIRDVDNKVTIDVPK